MSPTRETQLADRSTLIDRAMYNLSLPKRIQEFFAYAKPDQPGFFRRLQKGINILPREQVGGATYISTFSGVSPAIYAGDRRIFVDDRLVTSPSLYQYTGINLCVALCGTDLSIVDGVLRGDSSYRGVLGHEGLFLITGAGFGCDPNKIGRYYWLESHYADTMEDTISLDDSKKKGRDGIVTIQGSKLFDDTREEPFPGYFSTILTVDESSIPPFEIPWQMLEYMLIPRLESLGNCQQIMVELDERGYSQTADQTAMIIFGAGATGTPLALLAKSAGYHVIIVEPTEWRREITKEVLAGEAVFKDEVEANTYLSAQINSGRIKQTVTAVMTGASNAYTAAYNTLAEHLPSRKNQKSDKPNLLIAFGLLPDKQGQFPFPNAPTEKPKTFVLTGQSHPMPEIESFLLGVVGRSDKSWKANRVFLPKEDNSPMDPLLIKAMNSLMYNLPANGNLHVLADLLNRGSTQIEKVLRDNMKIKLGMYLVPGLKIFS